MDFPKTHKSVTPLKNGASIMSTKNGLTNAKSLDFQVELKTDPDDEGAFEGYASMFGVKDRGSDVVDAGAFQKSLGIRGPEKVKMLWQHDVTQPIGKWEAISEDSKGLHVKGRILPTLQKGREALEMLKADIIDSMSIGYQTVDAVREKGVRHLKEISLWEISLVTFPMLPEATVTSVKQIRTIRDFETALRDAGFTQNEAKAVAAKGFKGLEGYREGDDLAEDEQISSTMKLLDQLKEKLK